MIKILIDQNVIIDLLGKRGQHETAASLFGLCEKKAVKGYIAAHEAISIVAFLEENGVSSQKVEQILSGLFDLFTTSSVNEKIMKNAFNSNIKNYDQALLEQIAISEKIDYIVADDVAAFKKSKIKALTPAEILVATEGKK